MIWIKDAQPSNAGAFLSLWKMDLTGKPCLDPLGSIDFSENPIYSAQPLHPPGDQAARTDGVSGFTQIRNTVLPKLSSKGWWMEESWPALIPGQPEGLSRLAVQGVAVRYFSTNSFAMLENLGSSQRTSWSAEWLQPWRSGTLFHSRGKHFGVLQCKTLSAVFQP